MQNMPSQQIISNSGQQQPASIVALALSGESSIEVYLRGEDRVFTKVEPFQPWLIVAETVLPMLRRPGESERLAGDGYFNTLLRFESWSRWRDAYRFLRDNARSDVLAFPNPAEQYLVMSRASQFEFIEFDQVVRAQVDIETTSLDPHSPDARIIMIAVSLNGGNEVAFRGDTMSEADMLDALEHWIDVNDPDVIEGHNIFNFDIPYLAERARANNRVLKWGRDGSAVRLGGTRRFKAGARVIPFEPAYIRGRHVVDTYQQIQRYDYAGMLQSYGLKQSINALGLERADRQHVEGESIRDVWATDPERLVEYAIDDLRDTDMLSRLSLPTEFYQTRLLPSSLQDVATGGPGEKVNDLLVRAYIEQRTSIPAPRMPRGYPGGYTEVRRVGRFTPVVKCDVESLYPAIMLSDRIAPEADGLGVFLPLLQTLTTERLRAKREAAAASGYEQARWNGLQSSLKVLINSFYGYLGYSRGYFNDYDAAERVTLKGHEIITQVVNELERLGAETIEVDTDGVYFAPPDGVDREEQEEALIDAVSDTLDPGINLAHDGRWRAMLSLRLKNYALLGYDDRLVLKGSGLRSRRDEIFIRQCIEWIARAFLSGEAETSARELYFALADDILNGRLEPAVLARTETITDQTFKSPHTRKLAEALGNERIGERVSVYQRANGELARIDAYDDDEDRQYLLKRLKAAAERFRPLYDSQQQFEHDFPTVTLRTDLAALRAQDKANQMKLF